MSWKTNLIQASFRDVKFFVKSYSLSGGHNLKTFEYPGQQTDETFTQNISRKQKSFPIEALIIGDDYQSRRNELITAFEDPTPGVLVHPTYGRINCYAGDYRISENIHTDGRQAVFSITFTPVGKQKFPVATQNDKKNLKTKTDDLKKKNDKLSNKYFNSDPVQSTTKKFFDSANKAAKMLSDMVAEITTPLDEQTRAIAKIRKNLQTLVNTPKILQARLTSSINGLNREINAISNMTRDDRNSIKRKNKSSYEESKLATVQQSDDTPEEAQAKKVWGLCLAGASMSSVIEAIGSAGNLNISDTESDWDYWSKEIDYMSDLAHALNSDLEATDPENFFLSEADDIQETLSEIKTLYYKIYNTIKNSVRFVEGGGRSIIEISFAEYGDLSGIEIIEQNNNIKNYEYITGQVAIL